MAVQIGAKPDSSFDDPLGMLQDCHRRIEKFLAILSQVAERLKSGPLTEEETSAVNVALHYFAEGGQRHNQDEEISLLPRLRNAGVSESEILRQLRSDHHDADELHGDVRRVFSAWISSGSIAPGDRQMLRTLIQRLKALYAEHIRLEEEVVFPRAAQVLDSGTIKEMGSEFRARRGLAPS